MDNYEINEDTLAIIPINENSSKIIEKENEYVVNNNSYSIMEESCEYYGSSFLGRMYASRKILECSYKVPILIEESECIIFFPTKSALHSDCCWLNANGIKKCVKEGNLLKILFINGKEINMNISKLIIENQILKSIKLESIIRKRQFIKK